MSGYLRRLAERTLRIAPPVHSTAGRLYAPIPAPSEVELLLGDAKPLSPVVSETAFAVPAKRDTTLLEPHESTTSQIRPNPELRRHDIAARTNPPSRDNTKDNAKEEILPPVSEHGKAGQQLLVEVESTRPRVLPQSEQEPDDEFVPLVKTATPLDPAMHQAMGWPIGTTALSSVRPRPYVPMARGAGRKVFDTPVPEASEVHVTIGRIEVTAVRPPSPAKPAPSPAKKPMSLEEYLAKRDGGHP